MSIEGKLPDFHLLFVRRCGNYDRAPGQAWQVMDAFIQESHLNPLEVRYFGISHDNPHITSEEKLRYDACILAPHIKEKGEVSRHVLKGGKYAIFTHRGPYSGAEGIGETFDNIFLKWLPASSYTCDETRPVFCEYFHREYVKTDQSKLVTKIYIPLA